MSQERGQVQPPPGYDQPPPGYAEQAGASPVDTPESAYKGFNACCCCSVKKGARAAAIAEIVCGSLNFLYFIVILIQYYLKPVDLLKGLSYSVIVYEVITVANLAFSILFILALKGRQVLWVPIGWITTSSFRIVLAIVVFAEAADILVQLAKNDSSAVLMAKLAMIAIIVMMPLIIIFEAWWITIMASYICYMKRTGTVVGSDTTAAAAATTDSASNQT